MPCQDLQNQPTFQSKHFTPQYTPKHSSQHPTNPTSPLNGQINRKIMRAKNIKDLATIVTNNHQHFNEVNTTTCIDSISKMYHLRNSAAANNPQIRFVCKHLADLAHAQVGQYMPRQVMAVLTGFTRLAHHRDEMLTQLLQRVEEHVMAQLQMQVQVHALKVSSSHLSGKSSSSGGGGGVSQQQQHEKVLGKRKQGLEWDPGYLSSVLQIYTKSQMLTPEFAQAISHAFVLQLKDADPRALTTYLWSVAKCNPTLFPPQHIEAVTNRVLAIARKQVGGVGTDVQSEQHSMYHDDITTAQISSSSSFDTIEISTVAAERFARTLNLEQQASSLAESTQPPSHKSTKQQTSIQTLSHNESSSSIQPFSISQSQQYPNPAAPPSNAPDFSIMPDVFQIVPGTMPDGAPPSALIWQHQEFQQLQLARLQGGGYQSDYDWGENVAKWEAGGTLRVKAKWLGVKPQVQGEQGMAMIAQLRNQVAGADALSMSFSAQDVQNGLWALAKLYQGEKYAQERGQRDDAGDGVDQSETFRACAKQLVKLYLVKNVALPPTCVGLVLWSLATLHVYNQEAVQKLCQLLDTAMDRVDLRHVGNMLWALAQLRHDDEASVLKIATAAADKIDVRMQKGDGWLGWQVEMTLVQALLSTAKLGGQDIEGVVVRLAQKYMDMIDGYGEQLSPFHTLSKVIWACTCALQGKLPEKLSQLFQERISGAGLDAESSEELLKVVALHCAQQCEMNETRKQVKVSLDSTGDLGESNSSNSSSSSGKHQASSINSNSIYSKPRPASSYSGGSILRNQHVQISISLAQLFHADFIAASMNSTSLLTDRQQDLILPFWLAAIKGGKSSLLQTEVMVTLQETLGAVQQCQDVELVSEYVEPNGLFAIDIAVLKYVDPTSLPTATIDYSSRTHHKPRLVSDQEWDKITSLLEVQQQQQSQSTLQAQVQGDSRRNGLQQTPTNIREGKEVGLGGGLSSFRYGLYNGRLVQFMGAVEVQGPYHYCVNSGREMNDSELRGKIMEALGWQVGTVRWEEWVEWKKSGVQGERCVQLLGQLLKG